MVASNPGYDALWLWFGLSYASWLTLPRALMHAMPDKWQADMARLLTEFYEEFDPADDLDYFVQAKRNGRYVPLPDWTSRAFYRHPDQRVIDSLRRRQGV